MGKGKTLGKTKQNPFYIERDGGNTNANSPVLWKLLFYSLNGSLAFINTWLSF